LGRFKQFSEVLEHISRIPYPVLAGELPKVKKLKIGVARKPDLIEPN
jgi:hypothetical protein